MKLTPDEESDNVIALLFKECKTSGAEEDLHYNFEEFNYDYQDYNSFNLHSRFYISLAFWSNYIF